MAEVDSLTIRINAETGSAVAQLKQVASLVEKLNTAAKDNQWKSFAKSLNRAGSASKNLGKLTDALRSIQSTQISPKLKENLDKIADASAKLSGVGKGISQFSSGLARLSKLGEGTAKLGENLRRVSSHVTDFSRSISKQFPKDFAQIVAPLSKLVTTIRAFSKIGEDVDLKKKFTAVADAVGSFANRINEAVSEETLTRLERMASALSQIAAFARKAGKALTAMQKVEKSQAEKDAKSLADKWKMVLRAVEAVNKAISEMGNDLYSALDSTGIVGDLDGMTGAIAKNIPVLGELTSAWKNAASQIKSIVLSNASVVDKAANLMLVKVSLIVRTLYSLVKMPFGSASMGITKGIVGTLIKPFTGFIKTISELSKRWDKFVSSLARIAVYRLIRSALKEIAKAIKEGVQNLYQWGQAWQNTYSSAAKFVESMDKLATAFLYLKNSIGAAVSPLIDVVAPVIDALVDKFVALTNAINQALAALSGAGVWRRALKYQYTYAEAAGLTAKALKRTVLAFDELNKLDDKNKGGKSDNLDYSKMFEEVPVDDWLAKILDSSSWRILGTGIADKINEVLENLNWSSIKSSARIWARRFGSLLDGVLMGISMPLVGKTLAEGLNTIALSINTFFKEFHFRELGKNLSEGFKEFIDTLEWAEIGKAITQKWKALFELVIGFKDVDLTGLGQGISDMFVAAIENLPIKDLVDAIKTLMPKVATELGIAINGVLAETNKVIGGIDAEGLGSSFATAIDNMLSQIDPKEAGVFLSNGIKKIIEFTTGALKTTKWAELNTWVSDMISSLFENIDLKQGVQNAIDLASKLVELLTTVVNSIPWEEVGDAIANADTTELKNGIKGLFESVADGLESAGFMDEVATGIATYFGLKLGGAIAKVLPSILTAKAFAGAGGAASGGGLFASFGGLSGMLTMDAATVMGAGTFGEIAAFIGTGIVGSLAAWFGGQKLGTMLGKLIFPEDASYYDNFKWFGEGGLFDAMLDYTKFKLEDFGKFFNEKVGAVGDAWTSAWNNIKEGDLAGFIGSIGDAWEAEHPLITSGLDAIKDKFGTLKTKVEGFGSTWSTTFNNMKNNTNSALDQIREKFDGVLGFLTGGINQLANSLNTLASTDVGKAARTSANASRLNVRTRATGGMVDKGDLFLAGEAGPEIVTSFGGDSAVMNMDQIISTIAQSVAMAGGGGDITIPINLDGGMLDKVIVTAQQRQSLRSGR